MKLRVTRKPTPKCRFCQCYLKEEWVDNDYVPIRVLTYVCANCNAKYEVQV